MNKTALITGGSSGLGLEMAKNLQARGYDLILLARDQQKLDQTRQQLLQRDDRTLVKTFSCDIANEDELADVFKKINTDFDRIDFLVLNAGIATIDLLGDYRSVKDVTSNIKINLLGAVATTYLSMPLLQPGAHVLFISSGFGLVGAAGYSLYASAKAGLINFADALRRELLHRQVSVHVTCPGDIDTPMLAGELENMPAWMRNNSGRGTPRPADKVADYVLKKCFRKNFMIVPSLDVSFLILVQKLLPRRLTMYIIDHVLPLPHKPENIAQFAKQLSR